MTSTEIHGSRFIIIAKYEQHSGIFHSMLGMVHAHLHATSELFFTFHVFQETRNNRKHPESKHPQLATPYTASISNISLHIAENILFNAQPDCATSLLTRVF
jgi:hypothetical protein